MASKGERRYGKPPKIGRKSSGESDVEGDEDKSGDEEKDSAKAKKTAGKPKAEAAMDSDKGPEPTEAAGSDHIPVHARHAMERAELNHSHAMEHGTMNARHEMEHMSHDMGKGDA